MGTLLGSRPHGGGRFSGGLEPDAPAQPELAAGRQLLGFLPGASGLYFLRRRSDNLEKDLALGALLPSFFWISQGASFLFPGAEGLEAEFPEKVPEVGGVWLNERFASALMLALIAAGYAAERGR